MVHLQAASINSANAVPFRMLSSSNERSNIPGQTAEIFEFIHDK